MLIVFLMDTSASMNQRCANGLSLLDCAKSSVEHFHKVRSRDASSRLDRYMLVTCEDGPDAIKAVDKYPFTHFMRALKSVQARDLTNIGSAMQRIFSFLHVQRLAVDIDKFGQGRNPCQIDPTTIMLLTDGTELTSLAGVTAQLQFPGPVVGADLQSQPFRWDQRVFATVLRIPSVSSAVLERSGPIPQNAPISGSHIAVQMDNTISTFCEYTGGKCFVATSWKVLMQHTEVTATRLPPCVIVSFDHMPLPGSVTLPPQEGSSNISRFAEDGQFYRPTPAETDYNWRVIAACQRKMLYVRGGQAQQGHWPIPEAFWPDPTHPAIPPRESHPTISYKAVDADPFIPPNFTSDRYEIESNPIMGFLLKAPTNVCWQVYVKNSKGTNHGYGDPFGYLRLNRGGTSLTLIVLPYNYPVLWQLLDQVAKGGSNKIPPLPQWRLDIERYCLSIPSYYGAPLRAALKRWGLNAHVVPDSMENSLVSGFVGQQLKRLRLQAKQDLDDDMKRILTEQQLLGVNTGSNTTFNYQGRILPLESTTSTEAPPGFSSGTNAGAANNTASTPLPATPPCRGVGHGDQLGARKGWEALIPNGPSTATGILAITSAGSYGGQGTQNLPAYGSTIGNQNSDNISASASIGVMKDIPLFKNPFDVPRDQLLRQLQYLPIRIAVAMDTRQSRRMDNGKGKSSAISVLAARLAAKEEDEARHSLPIEKMGDFNEALMKQQPPRNPFAEEQDRTKQQRTMFGNPYRQEKNDGADEAWMEGPGGPLFRGRKRRRRQESPSASTSSLSSSGSAVDGNSEAGSANAEVTSPARTLPELQPTSSDGLRNTLITTGTKVYERLSDSRSTDVNETIIPTESRDSPMTDAVMAEENVDARKVHGSFVGDKQSVTTSLDFPTASSESLDIPAGGDLLERLHAASEEPTRCIKRRRLVHNTPLGTEKDRQEVLSFLLTIVRALRYSKPSNTQKLFELLSSPDFPVDKTNFLEQLIVQAEKYNKIAVAKELVDYRNQLTNSATVISEKA
ncbi:hypothetical protein MPTK1_1g02770 [Marchantia polymorpha subsp. ruderalis]|uniref:VWFA domain-containing protein n=2 Tax=Marchantia polymorpha TaxID=3197 RepID=A0AAF6AKU5_MARPO|nr:hypothetical protein MARPO_0113s0025 [Marchantia polymorpha]BBM97065.1 hypothetical protein Mp_1g02770 [Marchantia polymorpha subsp. ruderalis]|eukprot:PTQ31288.1 hypothetical protein MARPO_0113s0025 [Marchantia polymorpha]